MIKLSKLDEPQVLKDNSDSWTNELLRSIKDGADIPSRLLRNRYSHNEVKEKLRLECFGKCMYCESKISHVTHEHVEHIKPNPSYAVVGK